MSEPTIPVSLVVNDLPVEAEVPVRMLLSDFLRHQLRLTATHVGCEHGVCGACTVLIDGQPARSCLTLAATAHGARVKTVEGLSEPGGELHPVQAAFAQCHGLQCGFCTPGFLMNLAGVLDTEVRPDDAALDEAVGANLCRCTGYQNIRAAARMARDLRFAETTDRAPANENNQGDRGAFHG